MYIQSTAQKGQTNSNFFWVLTHIVVWGSGEEHT